MKTLEVLPALLLRMRPREKEEKKKTESEQEQIRGRFVISCGEV